MGGVVVEEVLQSDAWTQLSESFSNTIEALDRSVVAVFGGGRSTSSGVIWRPGIVVTTHSGVGHREAAHVIHGAAPFSATVIGRDPGTDVAVLRLPSEELPPIQKAGDRAIRAGEIVLSIGRSRLGDLSASCGIIARTGSAWRTWRGGQIDHLIRPDVRLYVGQSGSALVDRQRRVIGINSPALARMAVITIPAQTIDRVVDAILERGHMPRPFLGIAMQAVPVPEAVRSEFSGEAGLALLVTHVESKGPAAMSGAMVGDLILSVNGEPVDSVRDIMRRLADSRIGETISLVVIRAGVRVNLAVNVADRG
jgi:S1-C subfamily serine protease